MIPIAIPHWRDCVANGKERLQRHPGSSACTSMPLAMNLLVAEDVIDWSTSRCASALLPGAPVWLSRVSCWPNHMVVPHISVVSCLVILVSRPHII
jgi:hypothetical protein